MAYKKWNAHLDQVAMPEGIYRCLLSAGWPRATTADFLNVYITPSMAECGVAVDMMMAGME